MKYKDKSNIASFIISFFLEKFYSKKYLNDDNVLLILLYSFETY